MKSKSREWNVAILITIGIVIIAVVGFVIGRYTIQIWFLSDFEGNSRAHYLGNLLSDDEKKAISQAYLDSDSVYTIIDDISWAVENMPTPFVGNAPTPGVHGVAQINAMQFRSRRELVIPKPRNTFRIFLTGGSTAFGSGAPSEDKTIGSFLANILNRKLSDSTQLNYEVFTMANPAWATTHERIIIENRLSELEPDLVISFSGNNDVHWGQLGRNILWFNSYADDFFLGLTKKSYELTGQDELPKIITIEKNEIPPEIVAQRLIKNVSISSYALMQKEVNYIFVLQPTLATTSKQLSEREVKLRGEREYFTDCYTKINGELTNFHADNFNYVNLSTVFNNLTEQEEVFLDSYHFGDRGNKIIANGIYNSINSDLLKK